MAQIPLMPQMTGGNSSTAITSESESELFSLSAEGMVIGIPFDRALQELLTPQDSEGGMQLFAMQLPVDVENQPLPMPMPMLTQVGKLLPLPQQADGKPLPQISEQPLLTIQATELPAPVSATLTQKVQTEVAVPKFANLVNYINTEKPVDLLPLISAESSDRASPEVSRGSDSASPFSLNALSQSASSSAVSRPAIALPLNTPVGQPGWDQAVGERVQWMVSQNVQQAEIKLTPPNLGPLEIRISVHNDQTNVTFIAAQAPTREALESSIPRLREMFGEINLNLANVDVGQHQTGEPGRDGSAEAQASGVGIESESSMEGWSSDSNSTRIQSGNGLLDTYA
ncbi:MAG: flagellar hook-length control protein FliK [Candidatus Thiodiazotropha sp. 6PLUC5]